MAIAERMAFVGRLAAAGNPKQQKEVVAGVHDGMNGLRQQRQVLLNMEVNFVSNVPAHAIHDVIDGLENRIRQEHPEVRSVFLEIEALRDRPGPESQPP